MLIKVRKPWLLLNFVRKSVDQFAYLLYLRRSSFLSIYLLNYLYICFRLNAPVELIEFDKLTKTIRNVVLDCLHFFEDVFSQRE